MNIILEGPDATGKSTLANKLIDKYNMQYSHFPSADLETHLNALDSTNTVFDRFHIGELVYPEIYNREPKFKNSIDDANTIMNKIVHNGDLLIIFITSDISILKQRLIDRGEYEYLNEIEQQNLLFREYAWVFNAWEYEGYYIIDIAKENAYNELDNWIAAKK